MKKIYLTALAGIFALNLSAQLPVSTSPENKNVVLEEYTGIYCVFCPDGHKKANNLKNNNPGDVVLINYHIGNYANPRNNDPDFRTTMGTLMTSGAGIAGYPAGSVNRRVFPQYSQQQGGMAMSRNSWANAASTILAEPSYVNMAMDGYVDLGTRQVTLDVEVYFTATAATATRLFIVLTQNEIEGPQTGGSSYNPSQMRNGKYIHGHMFRDVITSRHGDLIDTTGGKLVKFTYNYTLPDDVKGIPVVPGDIEIAGFIAEGSRNIITGAYGNLSFGFVGQEEFATEAVKFYPNPAQDVLRMDLNHSTAARAELAIYDVSGKKILNLLDKNLPAGEITELFDISALAPGSYIIKSTIAGKVHTEKLLVQ